MDDADLHPIDEGDLRRRCPELDELPSPDRFRCFVLLARSEYIGTRGNGLAGWRFWARHHAPQDAHRTPQKSGPAT